MRTTFIAAIGFALAIGPANAEDTAGYAPVNGLSMYYEIHGAGEPLVLLHGAYMSIDANWAALIPALAATRQVIAIDLQGHGRTTDADRPITFEGMADDVAALLAQLGITTADFFGHSMGASVAMQMAIRHPGIVDQVIAASPGTASAGWAPTFEMMIGGITPEMFAGTPMAANPGLPVLIDKLRTLDLTPFAFPDADIAAITAPTFLIFGDADIITLDHAINVFALLGGPRNGDLEGLSPHRLAILPATTHTAVFLQTELLVDLVGQFLAGEAPRTMMAQ